MTESEQSVSAEMRTGRRAEQKRRWDRENLATCSCGRRMSRRASFCQRCQREADAERVREKRSYIRSYWAMGMTMREIAAGLDTTPKTVAMEIQRMRRLGWDVPYRQRSRRS